MDSLGLPLNHGMSWHLDPMVDAIVIRFWLNRTYFRQSLVCSKQEHLEMYKICFQGSTFNRRLREYVR